MRPATRSSFALAAFLCVACIACRPERLDVIQEDPALESSPPSSAKLAELAGATTIDRRDHFKHSENLLRAVITGNLVTARRHSRWLAQRRKHEELAPWSAQVARLQAVAREGMLITDIATAAQVIAKIGVTCAECHTRAGRPPHFAKVPMPETSSEAKSRMRVHPWAAARMWEGLTGPSSELWNLGASALRGAPLHSDAILQCTSAASQIVSQAQAVHDLADEGGTATSPAARADVFARLVETCASCHQQVRRGPSGAAYPW